AAIRSSALTNGVRARLAERTIPGSIEQSDSHLRGQQDRGAVRADEVDIADVRSPDESDPHDEPTPSRLGEEATVGVIAGAPDCAPRLPLDNRGRQAAARGRRTATRPDD